VGTDIDGAGVDVDVALLDAAGVDADSGPVCEPLGVWNADFCSFMDEVPAFSPQPECTMPVGPVPLGTTFRDSACHTAFVEQICLDGNPPTDIEFATHSVVLLGGASPTCGGALVLESMAVCGDELEIDYHLMICGDTDVLCDLWWLVRVPDAGDAWRTVSLRESASVNGPDGGCTP
jgi:hypothetical protein